ERERERERERDNLRTTQSGAAQLHRDQMKIRRMTCDMQESKGRRHCSAFEAFSFENTGFGLGKVKNLSFSCILLVKNLPKKFSVFYPRSSINYVIGRGGFAA